MTTDHEFAVVASTTDVQKVFVAIELSKSTWVVAIQPPGSRQSESVSDWCQGGSKVTIKALSERFDEGGYLKSVRSLVHAELFDEELEQARELLASRYTVAAAVVARVVLETTLRTLYMKRSWPPAAATSSARFALSWPLMSRRSGCDPADARKAGSRRDSNLRALESD